MQVSSGPNAEVRIDHAYIAHAVLSTSGTPKTLRPKYALCSMLWEGGLSIVDYALLSTLAYFDFEDQNVPMQQVQSVPPDLHIAVVSALLQLKMLVVCVLLCQLERVAVHVFLNLAVLLRHMMVDQQSSRVQGIAV